MFARATPGFDDANKLLLEILTVSVQWLEHVLEVPSSHFLFRKFVSIDHAAQILHP
jgi:hypothetical protein